MNSAREFALIDDFGTALDAQVADIVEPFDAGIAVTTPSLPLVWDANYLWVQAAGVASAEELADAAERVQGGAGLAHRQVAAFDQAEGERLQPQFDTLGWETQVDWLMILRSPPPRPNIEVVSVDDTGVDQMRRAMLHDDDGFEQDMIEQLREWDRRFDGIWSGSPWFAVIVDGHAVSSCRLFSDGRVGQVEDVVTHPEHRGRGYAQAVVSAASHASIDAGHELTFLYAESQDWPWKMYAKLGFKRARDEYTFRLAPKRKTAG